MSASPAERARGTRAPSPARPGAQWPRLHAPSRAGWAVVVAPSVRRRFIRMWARNVMITGNGNECPAYLDIVPAFDIRFPKGMQVTTSGLSKRDMNGRTGTVVKLSLIHI